jgi:hypothetical protein
MIGDVCAVRCADPDALPFGPTLYVCGAGGAWQPAAAVNVTTGAPLQAPGATWSAWATVGDVAVEPAASTPAAVMQVGGSGSNASSAAVAAPLQCLRVGVVPPPEPATTAAARLCGSALETAGPVARPNSALAAARAAAANLAASPWGSVEAGQTGEAQAQLGAIAAAAAAPGGVYDVWAWVAVEQAALLAGGGSGGGNGTGHAVCTPAGLAANSTAAASLPQELAVVNRSLAERPGGRAWTFVAGVRMAALPETARMQATGRLEVTLDRGALLAAARSAAAARAAGAGAAWAWSGEGQAWCGAPVTYGLAATFRGSQPPGSTGLAWFMPLQAGDDLLTAAPVTVDCVRATGAPHLVLETPGTPWLAAQRLVLSDLLPPGAVVVVGNTAPSASEAVGVNCTLRSQSAGASSGSVVVRPLPLAQVPAGVAAALTSGGVGGGGAHLLAAVSVELAWDRGVNGLEPRWQAALVCSVASVPVAGSSAVAIYASPRSVVVDVEVARPRFPFFADVVAELESQRALRSAWSSALVEPAHVTAARVAREAAAASSNQTALSDAAEPSPSPVPLPAVYSASADELFGEVRGATRVPDDAGAMVLVTVGRMNVTFVADGGQWLTADGARFPDGAQVAVGDVPCRDVRQDRSGRLLRCILPPTSEVCPHLSPQSSEDCGLQPITITAPGASLAEVLAGLGRAVGGDMGNGTLAAPVVSLPLALNVSCPPFCPGSAARGSAVPIPVTPVSLWAPAVTPSMQRVAAVGGVYYTARCSGLGFADPASGVCANASAASAGVRCAFGAGEQCVECPSWAICPGESAGDAASEEGGGGRGGGLRHAGMLLAASRGLVCAHRAHTATLHTHTAGEPAPVAQAAGLV